MLNNLIIKGRLTEDCKAKTFDSGSTLVEFSIAVNDDYKDKKEVHFFNVKFWAKRGGEAFMRHHSRGSDCILIGAIKQERWEKDGVKQSKVIIDASGFEWANNKADPEGRSESAPSSSGNESAAASADINDGGGYF